MGDIGQIGAAGINAASDLATVTATNIANKKMNDATNAANLRLHAMDNAFNHQEANLAYARQIDQWQRENEYNTPEQQVARYEQAGLNPAIMLQGTSTTAASSSSQPMASSAPPIQQMPFRLESFQPAQSMANLLVGFSQAKKNLSESGKTDVESRQIESKLNEEIRSLQLDNIGKEIANDFAPYVNSSQLERNASESFALYNSALKSIADGRLSDAETSLSKARAITERWRSEEQKVLAESASKRIQSQIDESRSRARLNNATANMTDEERAQLTMMRDYNVNIARSKSQLSQAELQKVGATLRYEIEYILGHLENLSQSDAASLRELLARAKQSEWHYDMRWVDFTLNTLERINNGITNYIPFAPDKETMHDAIINDDGSSRIHVRTKTHSKGR